MHDVEHTGESQDRAWRVSTGTARSRRDQTSVRLTPRELEVLTLLCQGLSNKLISRRLHISGGTVKTHVGNVLRALGASSRLHAVVVAREWGLAPDTLAVDNQAGSGPRANT
jgi:DNA-binding NarL/FixJ family response regulator